MRGNTIEMRLEKGRVGWADSLYQYDYGQRLIFTGVELPVSYEVHFSNQENGQSKTMIGDSTGVDIPDEYLLTGKSIHVWVYLHDGTDDGETEYHGMIGVTGRAQPTDQQPTPVQQDVITQTIAALNNAVEQTGQELTEAIAAKNAAEEAQGNAENAQEAAEAAMSRAEDAQSNAEIARGKAETAQGKAETAAQTATQKANEAAASAATATEQAGVATQKAENAALSASSAEGSATTASTKAGEASQSATSAAGSATTAGTKATEAGQSATAAAGSATTAGTKATEASTSATAAANAQTAAEAAQTGAETAQEAAETAQAAAEASAEAAAQSAASLTVDDEMSDSSTNPVQNKVITEALETKAEIDGYYESMTVGNAEQLVATVGVEDSAPYNFRTAGGSADIGDRMVDKLVGGTVAWNQKVRNGNFASTSYWTQYGGTLTVDNNIGTFTFSGTPTAYWEKRLNCTIEKSAGHKHLFSCDVLGNHTGQIEVAMLSEDGKARSYRVTNTEDVWTHYDNIVIQGNANTSNYIQICPGNNFADYSSGDYIKVKNFIIIDLTQMFGSTIADYIYSLETATPGAGVAWFRKLFPKDYYEYNAGELMSVQAASHITRGFNAWDEEWEVGNISSGDGQNTTDAGKIRSKNYIPILPNTQYYVTSADGTKGNFVYFEYDSDKNYLGTQYSVNNGKGIFTTSANAHYIRFRLTDTYGTTYNNDICINLSWDGERDGEYESYVEHVYPLDDSLTLRGIPKLDASNNLYYDGDTYESDGTVTRRFNTKDLGSFNWNKDSNRPGVFYSATFQTVLKQRGGIMCHKYVWGNNGVPSASNLSVADKTISLYPSYGGGYLFIVDIDKAEMSVEDFKTAVTGIEIVYESATATTETADPYQNPQIVDDFGTEEYVDTGVTAATPTRDVAIPVGHETTYQANLRAKLEMAPDSPSDGDGDYIVRQTDGTNEYAKLVIPTELPTNPTTDGTYHLKATVSNGTTTLTWEADT